MVPNIVGAVGTVQKESSAVLGRPEDVVFFQENPLVTANKIGAAHQIGGDGLGLDRMRRCEVVRRTGLLRQS